VDRPIALLVAALALGGCHPKARERLVVAVSEFPIADLVRRIAGPDADVALVASGAGAPAGARVFVSVGLGFDPWMDALAAQAPPKSRVLKVGERVPTLTMADGAIDPYVWMDPQRARVIATAIAEDLARADASHAVAFSERASALDASLAALDKEIEASVAAWPSRDVPALPPSMAYFAERYGLHAAPAASATAHAGLAATDALGGDDTKLRTYEDLIRFDAAALKPSGR
jgi:ABC-type Zn uptake system ZnuABC Zn-binding protein ZnuA